MLDMRPHMVVKMGEVERWNLRTFRASCLVHILAALYIEVLAALCYQSPPSICCQGTFSLAARPVVGTSWGGVLQ